MCEERKNEKDATIRCLLSTTLSTCFGHHYAHLQENKDRVTAFDAAPHNRYQPHPAEPAQYTKCSNTVFVLLKMGIMMPVDTEVNNKHLIVASCWFFSLFT